MKFVEGKCYYLEFLDHAVGIKTLMKIRAVGWVVEDFKNGVHFSSWDVVTEDEGVKNDNIESFTILKSAIIKKRQIKGIPARNDPN